MPPWCAGSPGSRSCRPATPSTASPGSRGPRVEPDISSSSPAASGGRGGAASTKVSISTGSTSRTTMAGLRHTGSAERLRGCRGGGPVRSRQNRTPVVATTTPRTDPTARPAVAPRRPGPLSARVYDEGAAASPPEHQPVGSTTRLSGNPLAARVDRSASRPADTEYCDGTGTAPLGSPVAPRCARPVCAPSARR